MSDKDNRPYPVGYGKPPRHTQFKSGRSGNPEGRPRTSRDSDTLLKSVLLETVTAKENGREQRMTKVEAIFTRLVNGAAMGDHRWTKLLLRMVDNLNLFQSQKPRGGVAAEVIDGLYERMLTTNDHMAKGEASIDVEDVCAPVVADEIPTAEQEDYDPSLESVNKEP